jgi:hypothetical protein
MQSIRPRIVELDFGPLIQPFDWKPEAIPACTRRKSFSSVYNSEVTASEFFWNCPPKRYEPSYWTKRVCDRFFFDKGYILISRRYQIHPASATTHCPSGFTDAHSQQRKKNYRKEKSCYSNLFLRAAVLTPPRQYQKVRKVSTLKTMPSTRTMRGTTN